MELRKCSFIFGSEIWDDCKSVTKLFQHSDLSTYGNFLHSLIGLDSLIDFIRNANEDEVNQKHIDVVIERLESLKKLNPNLLVDLES